MILNAGEKRAIAALRRLAKRWPKSLWLLFDEDLYVMRRNARGERAVYRGEYDQAYLVESVILDIDAGYLGNFSTDDKG